MKKFIVAALAALLSVGYVMADTDIYKERKEIRKLTSAALKEKASKEARREAKKLGKEGWQVSPGALPIDKQIDRSYNMQMEYGEDGFPKYIMAEAQSVADNYDAAKMQALALAKINLAGMIQEEITALTENTVANKQLEPEEAATVVQSVQAAKSLISQSIGRIIPVVEVYRVLGNKNKEVLVRIAYNGDMAKAAAKAAIKKELEEKGEELQEKLDKALGW